MRIQPKEIFKSPNEAESRFLKVINQYDGYMNKLLRDNRTYLLIALLAVIMLVCTVIGWFWISNNKDDNIVVVEVNELGRAKYLGNVGQGSLIPTEVVKDYMVEAVLRDFIEYTRTIYADSEILNVNLQKAAGYCSTDITLKLRNELVAEDPFALIGKVRREVSIESAVKQTANTWQFDWFDISTSMNGNETGRIRYRGIFTVVINDGQVTEQERIANPLGVYIVDYNITRINEVLR